MEDQLKNGHLDFSDMITLCCRNPCLAILLNKKDDLQSRCARRLLWGTNNLGNSFFSNMLDVCKDWVVQGKSSDIYLKL